jgi:hypothetical protein
LASTAARSSLFMRSGAAPRFSQEVPAKIPPAFQLAPFPPTQVSMVLGPNIEVRFHEIYGFRCRGIFAKAPIKVRP